MSKRSQAFKKKFKFLKFQNNNSFQKNSIYINRKKVDDNTEYSILSNMFCNFLGLKKCDMEAILKSSLYDKPLSIFTDNFVIKDRITYEKMMSSLSKAFKEGENKEHERHLKEEDEAFKRGVKYGREQRENEMKNASKNDLKDNFIIEKRRMTNTEINKLYDEFNKTIQKCNDILLKFWL